MFGVNPNLRKMRPESDDRWPYAGTRYTTGGA